MKIALEQDIRKIDHTASKKYHVPSIVLMENSGIALAEEVQKQYHSPKQRIIIVVGMGNNGGDGMVCARHLFNQGKTVIVFLVGNTKKLSPDAALNYEMLKPLDIRMEAINEINGVKKMGKMIWPDDIVVDCLFGIGLKRDVDGVCEFVINEINQSQGYVIACDIPSGINASDGSVMKTAVRADKTVAICLPKVGNIMFPGADYNGELVVKRIGLSDKLIGEMGIPYQTISESDVRRIIPKRQMNSHKGTYGKASLIAGSFGMTGAAILAAKASLRSGIGLLKLVIPESLHTIITTNVPEVVTVPLMETRRGVFGINQVEKLIQNCKGSDVVAIGPGCGQNAEMIEVVRQLITQVDKPLVIDADGLNTLSKNVELLANRVNGIVITPHPGEMSRLTGLTIEAINQHPIDTATEFAVKWQIVVVLKGARTVVALPDGSVYVNLTGNPGMATAGSGDVLTGIITSLIAQGMTLANAAIAGVFLHGYSGDIMAVQRGEHGLIAGDLIEGITQAFNALLKQSI
ncbi:NAD(P)H-hydrate dehydratase [Fusibacter paucivorans]|uniref:Bifunctional NAD(P)H-hydrate repair enzyme n=1 Tax=Fusibacter paucivorans TaxID=76009 RepID=A0ABS5PPN0_9FIRM|nr:NAD(P)H-hydrate dehydratase [Fusibacter paucivorans]